MHESNVVIKRLTDVLLSTQVYGTEESNLEVSTGVANHLRLIMDQLNTYVGEILLDERPKPAVPEGSEFYSGLDRVITIDGIGRPQKAARLKDMLKLWPDIGTDPALIAALDAIAAKPY